MMNSLGGQNVVAMTTDDQYASSGEESFDMPSASQVGVVPPNNHHYNHRSNQQTQYILPTVVEMATANNRTHENDRLLEKSQQNHQQLQQNFNSQRSQNHGSATNSSVTSYNHHTGDSGMSAGQASNEHSSVRSDVDRPRDHIAQQQPHHVVVPAFIDEKFVGQMSPPMSSVSVHSGYNSTASSCWQFQQPNNYQKTRYQNHQANQVIPEEAVCEQNIHS